MLLFKELKDCLILLLTILLMLLKKLTEAAIANFFFPRVNITNHNALIDGRNFYDQQIYDQIKKYDEIRQIATGQGDDYTTDCLLDYQHFKDHYQLNAVDLIKQKELDADPRAIQQVGFYEILGTKSQVCTGLERSKETILEFYKSTAKFL